MNAFAVVLISCIGGIGCVCVCLDGERLSREVEFFFSRERVFREREL